MNEVTIGIFFCPNLKKKNERVEKMTQNFTPSKFFHAFLDLGRKKFGTIATSKLTSCRKVPAEGLLCSQLLYKACNACGTHKTQSDKRANFDATRQIRSSSVQIIDECI